MSSGGLSINQQNGETSWKLVSGKELKSPKISLIISSLPSIAVIIAQLVTKNYLLYSLSVLIAAIAVIMGTRKNTKQLLLSGTFNLWITYLL